jgi:hypothetical protein
MYLFLFSFSSILTEKEEITEVREHIPLCAALSCLPEPAWIKL